MKNKIFNFLKITLILSGILLFSNSCTKDKWYNDTYVETNRVDIDQWTWDANAEEYYAQVSFPLIDDFLLNNGTVNVVAIIDDTNKPLPYTSYPYVNNVELAQTISFEYGRGYIKFVVSALDGFSATSNSKPGNYTFYVTTISQAVN